MATQPNDKTKMKQGTVKELAKQYGIKDAEMNGAIHFLTATGHAECVGTAPKPEGQKGKSSKIYKINLEAKAKTEG